MNFDKAFEHVVGHEGGYVNDPRDNGGETKYGITIMTARAAGYKGKMIDLTLDEAKRIYKELYWDRVKGDDLPEGLDEFVFDFAVNSGVGAASKALQRAVGATADGVIGMKTLLLVRARNTTSIIKSIFVDRAMIFANHPDRAAFGKGWFNRLFEVTTRAINT